MLRLERISQEETQMKTGIFKPCKRWISSVKRTVSWRGEGVVDSFDKLIFSNDNNLQDLNL